MTVVDKVAAGRFTLQLLPFSPVSIIPLLLHKHTHTHTNNLQLASNGTLKIILRIIF
jgi:hypothetical protein